jgi:hypothetical protein
MSKILANELSPLETYWYTFHFKMVEYPNVKVTTKDFISYTDEKKINDGWSCIKFRQDNTLYLQFKQRSGEGGYLYGYVKVIFPYTVSGSNIYINGSYDKYYDDVMINHLSGM